MSSLERYHARILVIGAGGGGNNAIDRMINLGMKGVEFVAVNTDLQDLDDCLANLKVPIGSEITKGCGAGANPYIGYKAAMESYHMLAEVMEGADLVFVTAGMGGGTGTGTLPVLAKIAHESGILAVAVVTLPFSWEGSFRKKNANWGIEELGKYLKTVLTIDNQVLVEKCDPDMTVEDAFLLADETLMKGVSGITDIITVPGRINIDFKDIKKVLSSDGLALWGVGIASGPERASEATHQAISSPFLEDRSIEGAHHVIVNLSGGKDLGFTESTEVYLSIQEMVKGEPDIKIGTSLSDEYNDSLKVTVIAKGVKKVSHLRSAPVRVFRSMNELVSEIERQFYEEDIDPYENPEIPAALRARW